MGIINEKVAICYYKSTRTIVNNNHVTKVTRGIELVFCECKAKSAYYAHKSKAKKKLFKDI